MSDTRCMVFFDVDGTLRDYDTSIVPPSVPKMLARLRAAGYLLGVATGRDRRDLGPEVPTLADWDAMICANGQNVIIQGESVQDIFFPTDVMRACVAVSEAQGQPLELIDSEGRMFLTGEPNEYVRETHVVLDIPIPPVKPYEGEDISSIMAYGPRDGDFSVYELDGVLTTFPGNAPYTDVVLSGINKQSGIQFVLEHFGCDEYIAFGDSLNDIDMLRHAKLSVAVGDAHPETIRCAGYHTTGVLDDGLHKACLALGLYE